MFDWKSGDEWRRLFRYYVAGLLNMAFGFGLYALLVRFGLNIYLAQIISHVTGMAFNYITYSRYTFSGYNDKLFNYILSYAVIYFINLAALGFLTNFVKSPYLAGFLATVFVSVLNYFVLKRFVFEAPAHDR